MKLACAQLPLEGGDRRGNLDRALTAIDEAAGRGADLVALPELFDVGYFAFDQYVATAQSVAGDRIGRIADRAADNDVAVLAGTIVEDLEASAADGVDVPQPEGMANTAVFLDETGTRREVYRKHHLFGYGSEAPDHFVPGERLPKVEYGGFTIGMTTCYDLRFPELYRRLSDEGVDLHLVPSAWPYPRVEHWRTLSEARAIENLSYLATINGSASFEDADLVGRSTIYDPWGTALASSGEEPTIVTAELDPDRAAEVRAEFPALRDRRD